MGEEKEKKEEYLAEEEIEDVKEKKEQDQFIKNIKHYFVRKKKRNKIN